MKLSFESFKRMTIGAIVVAPILWLAWAAATYYILRAVEGILLAEIPALDQFDPHLVRAFVALASMVLIIVLRQMLFPFLPQIASWLSFGTSSSGLSRFRLGFFQLWALTLACGALIQYVAERPDPGHIFSSTGPRANICTHSDGRLTLQPLDTRTDYVDGSPCEAATPKSAAAFQAQRSQDEAAGKAAAANNSGDTAAPSPALPPSASQPPATGKKRPQEVTQKPTPKSTKSEMSLLQDVANWTHRNFSNNADAEAPTDGTELTVANPGSYHIRLRNMTGKWLRVRAQGSDNVREFNLAPDSDYEDTATRSGASILYTAEAITSNGAGATWRQAVDLTRIEEVFEIDLVPPQSSSTTTKGLPQASNLIGRQN